MEDDYEPAVQHQRRVNPKIHDVIKKEVEKLLDAGLIYPISDSPWGWRVCIDYRKLNEATRKDHFPLPLWIKCLCDSQEMSTMYSSSDFSVISNSIDPNDQEKTTFTCPYGTFAYRRMPFGLCNAPGTFQRCMMAIFIDMLKRQWESLHGDFLGFWNFFFYVPPNLEKNALTVVRHQLSSKLEKKSHFM
ncbi:hypothetical protein Tco_1194790 [Tanacetum coccineum]